MQVLDSLEEEEEGAGEEDTEDSKKMENDDTEKVDPSADVAEVDPPAEGGASSSHAVTSSPFPVKKEEVKQEAVPRKRARRGGL